jgi:hypothetical protein
MTLTRQNNKEANDPVTSHERSIDGVVSRPSRLLVIAKMGIRSREGKGPKYVYSLPWTMKPSTPREPLGTFQWPWKSARAWIS